MAITPNEANQLTEDELTLIEKIESEIDAYIKKNYNKNQMEIPIDHTLKERVKEELVARYKKAGWKTALFTSTMVANKNVFKVSPYETTSYWEH